MDEIWVGSPNYSVPTQRRVGGIFLHDGECTLTAMKGTFQTKGSTSAHKCIDVNGQRYVFVEDQNVAYHVAAFGNDPRLNRFKPDWVGAYNGLYSACNEVGLGVELVGYASQGYTPEQYDSLIDLLAQWSEKFGLDKTLVVDAGPAGRITTHGWVQTDRSDPGGLFDWDRVRQGLSPVFAVPITQEEPVADPSLIVTPDQKALLDGLAQRGITTSQEWWDLCNWTDETWKEHEEMAAQLQKELTPPPASVVKVIVPANVQVDVENQ